MSEWRRTTLGEFISLQRGHDLTDPERRPGKVPVMGSAGQNGYHDTALASGPGVVIGRSGASFGQVHYSPVDYWPHNTTLYVTDFHGNDPLFAYYLLKSIDFTHYNSGSAQPSLNRNYIYHVPISVPEPDTQRAISRILGDLDDKIELNRQINQTLEQMAQACFKSWFVDFEPVEAKIEAKAEGRDSERAAMCAISGKTDAELDQLPAEQRQQLAATAALFPDELVESELGLIPKGWEIQRLENILGLSYGKSLTKTDRRDGDFPVYGSGGIAGYHSSPLVPGPGIIVGRKGTVGALYWEDSDFFPIDTVFYAEAKNGATLEVLFYLLQTLSLDKMNTDAAVPGLNRNNVYRLAIPAYPVSVMLEFSKMVSPLRQRIAVALNESSALAASRDSLLPRFLAGVIQINTASS